MSVIPPMADAPLIPEVIPAEPAASSGLVPSPRRAEFLDETGHFKKGNPGNPLARAGKTGMKISAAWKMQASLMKFWDQHPEFSPAMILARIIANSKDERNQIVACKLLLDKFVPRATPDKSNDSDPVDFEARNRAVMELAKNPAIRAMIEKAEEFAETDLAPLATDSEPGQP